MTIYSMKCPYCESSQFFVTNSRVSGVAIWRRRKCQKCQGVFSSMERIVLANLKIIKKSGQSERYDKSKIYLGIYRAVNESKWISRSSARKITQIVTDKVEMELIRLCKEYIKGQTVGKLIMKILKSITHEGYLRFSAYFIKQAS